MRILIVFSVLAAVANLCGAQWMQTNGLSGGPVNASTLSGTSMFSGTDGGSLSLADNGASWTSAVLADSSATDSSAEDIRPDFMVLSMGYSKDTYVPSFGPAAQFGVYSLEFSLPVTYLPRDPYNEDKWNISWSALVPLGAGVVISVFHPQDVGPGVQKVLTYALMGPLLVANSQHHLVLVGPNGLVESEQSRLTALIGFRTDCYSRDVTWVRWTPMLGLQQAFHLTGEGEEGASKWLALFGGIEAPVDFIGGPHSIPSTWFIGSKYYIGIR